MEALPLFLKLQGRPVVLAGNGAGAEPKRRLLELAGARVVAEPEPGARLAVVAIDDFAEAEAACGRLRSAGLLVNAVDKPALCDFSFPAIVDRAPVTLAIGTGGASATLAKTLRERLEALLPERLGALAGAVRTMRGEVNEQLDGAAARRRFWDRLMAPGAALDPLSPAAGEPEATIRAALQEGSGAPSGSLYELRPRSNDPDDISLRDLRALSQADLILVEEGASEEIAGRARRDAVRQPYSENAEIPAGAAVVVVRRG